MHLLRLMQIAFVAAALGLFLIAQTENAAQTAGAQSSSTIGLLAIDANPQGNSATALGPVDGCARVDPGSTFDVDYVVDAVPADRPMIGFEAEIRYDQALVDVVGVDYQMLLAAVGTYSPLASLSDSVPDSDGTFRVSVLDTASSTDPEANVERGPGVLARITLRAKAQGVGKISIGVEQDPLLYPLVLDTQDEMILADRIASATVAIGLDCPSEAAQPQITDLGATNEQILAANPQLRPAGVPPEEGSEGAGATTTARAPSASSSPGAPRVSPGASSGNGDDGGSSTWPIVLVVVALVAVVAAAGGWYLYRRNRGARPGG